MINVKKCVPSAYYDYSRDFQLIGRTYEIVFNYILMNLELVKHCPLDDDTDLALIDLLLLTLGFKQTHSYTNVDMMLLAKVFREIMRIKGTKKAIEDCIILLLRSQHVEEDFELTINTLETRDGTRDREIDVNELYTVSLYLPEAVEDTVLIEDLFEYILPAGFIYQVYRVKSVGTFESLYTTVDTLPSPRIESNNSTLFGQVARAGDIDETYIEPSSNYAKTFTTVVVNSSSVEDTSSEV